MTSFWLGEGRGGAKQSSGEGSQPSDALHIEDLEPGGVTSTKVRMCQVFGWGRGGVEQSNHRVNGHSRVMPCILRTWNLTE